MLLGLEEYQGSWGLLEGCGAVMVGLGLVSMQRSANPAEGFFLKVWLDPFFLKKKVWLDPCGRTC